ncbi:MAG: tetratricopeptide repeat protein [Bacteroidaceae bacterium]|nr:tetratricopeptide repeat protein [Bacteroidaceae bacterium]
MNPNVAELIAHPEKLADRTVLDGLAELIARYPYYQAARLLYLRGLYQLRDTSFGDELRRTALCVPDRKVLFNLIEGEYYTLRPVVRKAKSASETEDTPADRTLLLIDAFLSGLPPTPEDEAEPPMVAITARGEEETSHPSPLPPVTDDGGLSADYTTYVLSADDLTTGDEEPGEATPPPMKGQRLIDDFIKNADENITSQPQQEQGPPLEQPEDKLPEIDEDDGYFTETLAKIYIKQQRYGKALEIIRRLSLKYPKKNAYFADQIRFLEKLIRNSNDK